MSQASTWVARYAQTDEIHRLIVGLGPIVRDVWQVSEVFEFREHTVLWLGPSADQAAVSAGVIKRRPDQSPYHPGERLRVWRLAGGTGLGLIALASLAGELIYPPQAEAVLAAAAARKELPHG